MRKWMVLALLVAILAGSGMVAAQTADVPVTNETEPSPGDAAKAILIWLHPSNVAQSLLVTTDEEAGIVTYDLQGALVQQIAVDGEANALDVRYSFPIGGSPSSLIAVGVSDEPTVQFFTVDAATRQMVPIGALETGVDHAGLCLYFSPTTSTYYLFNTGENDGLTEQWEITDDGAGGISGTLRRSFPVGSETESCTADDQRAAVFIAEGDAAVWRYGGEPESAYRRRIVDAVDFGIETELEGMTLYEAADGAGYLLVTDEKADRILAYDRDTLTLIGAFSIGADSADPVSEPASLDAVSLALGDAFPNGLLVVSDDQNTDPDDNTNFKLLDWSGVADALGLLTDPAFDLRTVELPALVSGSGVAAVTASVETVPVPIDIDAADDPSIWIHPTDPALSTVIGTDKTEQGGLVVYDLDGNILQQVAIGEVNNVDLRYNFLLEGVPTTIVGATNRTNNSLVLYRVDEATRELVNIAARDIISAVNEVYGFCMYHSAVTGDLYAIINSAGTGQVEQWRLFDAGGGLVDAELVRSFSVGSQTEGCAADDELGNLFIGEEAVGLWVTYAEPDAGDTRVLLDNTSPEGNLTADVEGIAIYYGEDGTGYVIVSSQGSSEFVIYDRAPGHRFIGSFVIVEGDAVDGVSGTDGIDVTNVALGDRFPGGLFVAQDDTNINPDGNQNFKLVSWERIAEALGLLVDTTFNPRAIGAP